MKIAILTWVVAVLLFGATPALAVGEYTSYFGLDYMLTELDGDSGGSVDLDAVAGRFGSYLSRNTALEARIGFSVSDETFAGVNYELDNFIGVFARGILPFQTVEFYGLIGISRVDLSTSDAGLTAEGDEVGFSYGAGLDFRVGEKLAIGFEYLMLIDESDYDLTTINVGGKVFF